LASINSGKQSANRSNTTASDQIDFYTSFPECPKNTCVVRTSRTCPRQNKRSPEIRRITLASQRSF
jgi:hypothetical protein